MGRILTSVAALAVMMAATPALAGNPTAGAAVFKGQCSVCHVASAHGAQGVGPRLAGVVGRKAGTSPGFAYSPAMKNSGLTWTAATLRTYLAAPAKVVKGTKMPYAGLHNAGQLEDLIAFLGAAH